MKSIFKTDPVLGVSRFRFYLLKFFYLLIILMLGVEVWTKIITHKSDWEPLPAVAYSFWGAFSALAIVGFIHPLKLLPLLLVQFLYKLIWLVIVAFPLWSHKALTGSPAEGLAFANTIGIILDILVIPWNFVFKNYILLQKKVK